MNSPATSLLAALLALTATGSSAFAADFYWKGGDGLSSTGGDLGNWYTTADATTFAAAPDSVGADLFFNRTGANALASNVTVDTNFTANSLRFSNSLATTLVQNATNRTLNLGVGGITVNSGAGVVNIGTNAHDPALTIQVTDDQTWTNSSSNGLTVRRLRTATDAGATAVTINAASSGAITVSTGIIDSVADPLAIVINSSGSGTVTFSGTGTQNTYRGGTTVKSGHLFTLGSLGSGSVFLGDTVGSANATLTVRSTSFANNITVRSESSGTKTLITNQSGGAVLNGTLTLNDNLTLTSTTDGTFNNTISGTGNISKGGSGALTLAGTNTFSGNLTLNTGAFTLAEAGVLTFYIGANGVTNQVNGSTTGAVAFNGTFNLNLSGANLTAGNTWTLVNLTAAETYGTSFALAGFTAKPDGVTWENLSGFSFSEATGILSYSAVPEPSTFALLGGLATLCFAAARRRTRA